VRFAARERRNYRTIIASRLAWNFRRDLCPAGGFAIHVREYARSSHGWSAMASKVVLRIRKSRPSRSWCYISLSYCLAP